MTDKTTEKLAPFAHEIADVLKYSETDGDLAKCLVDILTERGYLPRAASSSDVGVDVETLENEIVDYWSKQIVGMPISGIGGITATLRYLEAKGYL